MDLSSISEHEVTKELARRKFDRFVGYTKPDYTFEWFHSYVCDKLQQFADGEIKNLMIFMPPQHGKSELVSRRLPAYLLGLNPDLRIAGCSYSHTLAAKFNRSVQRIIDDQPYYDLFPETTLNASNVRTSAKGSHLRNSDEFEVVGHEGGYISVGVGGPLTGNPVDILIIDDVIKDAKEAYSQTIRENHWEWYTNVAETRLHNDSQKLLTITRWHEDDLAGRILADPEEAKDWVVVIFPAIKEDESNPEDPREIGEALWEDRHSLEKLEKHKRNKKTWISLYQQRPTALEGSILMRDWFSIKTLGEVHKMITAQDKAFQAQVNFVMDTAYTAKQENDPSAIMAYFVWRDYLFITNVGIVRKEFPDLCRYTVEWTEANSYTSKSRIYVEPKASGKSLVQQLKRETGLNVIEDEAPEVDKVARAHTVTATMEAGRVILIKGPWNASFVDQCAAFPNAKHDEEVDLLVMACNKLIKSAKKRRGIKSRTI